MVINPQVIATITALNTAEEGTPTGTRKRTGKAEICTNWWGKAWCKNLERYGYMSYGENPIKRGEKYIINNAVVDLRIQNGDVTAKVADESYKPFEVKIEIKPLSEDKIDETVKIASGKIQNIDALAAGDFPEDLPDILFPLPIDVELECNCPDHDYN